MSLTELMRALDQVGAAAYWAGCNAPDAEIAVNRCREYAMLCGASDEQVRDAISYGGGKGRLGSDAPLAARPYRSFDDWLASLTWLGMSECGGSASVGFGSARWSLGRVSVLCGDVLVLRAGWPVA